MSGTPHQSNTLKGLCLKWILFIQPDSSSYGVGECAQHTNNPNLFPGTGLLVTTSQKCRLIDVLARHLYKAKELVWFHLKFSRYYSVQSCAEGSKAFSFRPKIHLLNKKNHPLSNSRSYQNGAEA